MKTKQNTRYFETAGITFEIDSAYPMTAQTFQSKLKPFEENGPGNDCILIKHLFNIPERLKNLKTGKARFSSLLWHIFHEDGIWIYRKNQAFPGKKGNPVFMEFSKDLRSFKVYCDFLSPVEYAQGQFHFLTMFGFDQLLISRLLTERNGLILHSNGFIHNGIGKLLAGTSGSGKTTLTQMLKKHGIQVFADDRVIVKDHPDSIRMYGSWLHGTTPLVSKGINQVDTIFFLEHANQNKIIPVKEPSQKISLVLQAIVRPYIDAEGWEKLIDTTGNLMKKVSCYRLLFDLSGEIVKKIDSL